MNGLRQLLHDTSATEPPDRLDLTEVVRLGGRRRRHRRAATVASVAAATAVVAVVGATVGGPGPDDPAPATDGSVGPSVTLDEARPAVEGTDYRVLASRLEDRPRAERFVGVTDDGLGVVLRASTGRGGRTPVGLVDPSDGATSWLPGGPQPLDETSTIALGEDRLVFRESHWSDERLAVRVLDRAAGTWSTMRWPGLPPAQAYSPTEHDGRLYLTLYTEPGQAEHELWSVSLDDSSDVRDEHATVVGDLDVTGDELTWSDGSTGTAARVHVRDLVSGEEQLIDPHLDPGCGVQALERIGDRLLLGQVCGRSSDRLQVVTTEGDRVLTIDDAGVGGHIGDGGRVAVVSGGEGGPYVLDPVSGELWAVGAATSLWTSREPVPDGSDLTLWSTIQEVGGEPAPGVEPGADDGPATEHLVEWLS